MATDTGWRDLAATQRDYRLGLALVTGSAVAWSTAGFFTRLIPLDGATLLVWRGLFGGIGLLVLIMVVERRGVIAALRSMGLPGLGFAAVSALGMVCFITALRHTTVAHVAVIYATAPFVGATLAWAVLREAPGRGAVLASLVALAGVAVMVGLGREGRLTGDLLALGMTACMAAMMVITRRFPGIAVMPAAGLSALGLGLGFLALSAHVGLRRPLPADDAMMPEKRLFKYSILYLFVLFGMLVVDHLATTAGA